MPDNRSQGRQATHDSGSPTSRPRDDLRTASRKNKPNESRNEKRDREPTDDDKQAADLPDGE